MKICIIYKFLHFNIKYNTTYEIQYNAIYEIKIYKNYLYKEIKVHFFLKLHILIKSNIIYYHIKLHKKNTNLPLG